MLWFSCLCTLSASNILSFLVCEVCLPVASSTHPYIFLISARNTFWFMSFFQPASIKNVMRCCPHMHLWLMHHPNRLARASMNGVQQLVYVLLRRQSPQKRDCTTIFTTMKPGMCSYCRTVNICTHVEQKIILYKIKHC